MCAARTAPITKTQALRRVEREPRQRLEHLAHFARVNPRYERRQLIRHAAEHGH